MGMLIIDDGHDGSSASVLKGHKMVIDERHVILELTADAFSVTYEIFKDDCHTEISKIKQFIFGELMDAYAGKKPFFISEYLERFYISIGSFNAGESKRFSARKHQDLS